MHFNCLPRLQSLETVVHLPTSDETLASLILHTKLKEEQGRGLKDIIVTTRSQLDAISTRDDKRGGKEAHEPAIKRVQLGMVNGGTKYCAYEGGMTWHGGAPLA